MARFLLKLLLYLLPVGVFALVGFGCLFYAGEYTPLAQVASEQAASRRPLLYGRAYADDFVAYKLISARLRQPQLLVLGSSRVMQFRSYLVKPGAAPFYNAGGGAAGVFDLRRFLQGLDASATPRVMMVGLDQDWFHPTYAAADQFTSAEPINLQAAYDDRAMLNTSRGAVADWLAGRWSPFELLPRREPVAQADAIGIDAIAHGNGFRNDGSRQYGQLFLHPASTDQRLADARQRIQDRNARFEYADDYAPSAIAELQKFLDECARRGITVIGFSPPYAPSIYQAMAATGGYGYLPRLSRQLDQMFGASGFTYFDFTNGQFPGLTDDNFIDGFHGSEIVYTTLYLQMLDHLPGVLGQYSDAAALRAQLQQPRASQFQMFAND